MMKRMVYITCLALALSSGLAGLSYAAKDNTSGAIPAWVLEPQKEFSSSRYWVGIGQAKTLAAAQDKARGEVAKILQANIKVNNQYQTSVAQSTEKNKGLEQVSTESQQIVNVVSDVDLENVKIMKTYQDTKTGDFYVLAALDKDAALDRYQAELKKVGTQMQDVANNSAQAEQSGNRVSALWGWMQIQSLAQDKVRLDRWVKALGGEGVDTEALERQADQAVLRLKPQIKLAFSIDGEGGDGLRRAANSYFAKQGLRVINQASEADAVLGIQVNWDDVEVRQGLFIQTASMDLRLDSIDKAQVIGQVIEGCHVNVRKVASDKTLVQRDVSRALEQQLNQFIESVLFNKPMKGCV